ncbi:MAG TPA: NAD(P)H-hydrate dehydratase, partial [Dehalococcoidia bacterium]|nr:NAD(P)H-hydrate dehydratase [Dehalococcoidia bacterium]
VLLAGPGLSQRGTVRRLVGRLLEAAPESLHGAVADGDALNALAATPGWHERVRVPVVLTPHPGEMARLCDASVADVQANRLRTALDYADASGQVTVLKGAHTVVASPDGRAAVSPYANPLLAVAGTGDVLAGAIAGLLAQGAAPFEAAACGVFAHAMAAETLAEGFGDRGLLASELLPELPRTLRVIVHGRPARALATAPLGGLGDLASLAGLAGGLPPR